MQLCAAAVEALRRSSVSQRCQWHCKAPRLCRHRGGDRRGCKCPPGRCQLVLPQCRLLQSVPLPGCCCCWSGASFSHTCSSHTSSSHTYSSHTCIA